MNREIEYLQRRELRELYMARRARCPRSSRAHHHLASIYAARRVAIAPASLAPLPPSPWQALLAFLRGLGRSPLR